MTTRFYKSDWPRQTWITYVRWFISNRSSDRNTITWLSRSSDLIIIWHESVPSWSRKFIWRRLQGGLKMVGRPSEGSLKSVWRWAEGEKFIRSLSEGARWGTEYRMEHNYTCGRVRWIKLSRLKRINDIFHIPLPFFSVPKNP